MPALETSPSDGGSEPQGRASPARLMIVGFVSIMVVLVVFGIILPGLIDYDLVFAAIGSLSMEQAAILLVVALVRMVAEGAVFVPVLPGLRLGQATVAWSGSTAAASLVPGPWDMLIRYRMYRGWGFAPSAATLSFPLSGLFTWVVKLLLPVTAIAWLLVDGDVDATVWLLAGIGLVLLVTGSLVIRSVVQSERAALRIGGVAGRAVSNVMVRFHREPIEDMDERVLGFRREALQTLGQTGGWLWELATTTVAFMLQFVILVMSLRFMQVDADTVALAQIYAVFAFAQLLMSIPITPGGVGIAEVVYIGLLNWVANGALTNQIAAGVFLFRALTWLLVIPVGGCALAWWGRQRRRQVQVRQQASS